MLLHSRALLVLTLTLIVAGTATAQAPDPIRLVEAFPGLNFSSPTEIVADGAGHSRLFVLEQRGVITGVDHTETSPETSPFLNIQDRVTFGGEMGLLGLAFHPDYAETGYFFVSYVTPSPTRSRISRFTNPDPQNPRSTADVASEIVYLEVEQPRANHNGGQIHFGPDGYLYFGLGDSGGSDDPDNVAQDRSSLLGSVLRIDPVVTDDQGTYLIPPDNPFVGNTSGWREEIYAFGLRNPWKFAFGPDGRLWLADVGQNTYEEVNVVESGGNYGWVVMEGPACFATRPGNPPCNDPALLPPVHFYTHGSQTGRSITGGFVYRGDAAPTLRGAYIFADYVSGNVWALRRDGEDWISTQIYDACTTTAGCPADRTRYAISTFGEDADGELYLAHYAFSGRIFRIEGVSVSTEHVPDRRVGLDVFPNPVSSSQFELRLKLDAPASTRGTLHDILGREVAMILDEQLGSGTTSRSVQLPSLPAGVYLLRVEAGSTTVTRRLTLLQ
ncbi:PQQ-dependent sugar dehydrogenase [soil metagenome]